MKLFQTINTEIVTAYQFFGFNYQVFYCPNELKQFENRF